MTFIKEHSRYKSAFFVEYRGAGGAYRPFQELKGALAQAVPGVATDEMTLPVHPVWTGIVISRVKALETFGVPDVEALVVGAPTKTRLDALVATVLARPPLGLVAVENPYDSDLTEKMLPLRHFLLPRAIVSDGEVGRRYSAMIGVDVIGFRDEIESGLVFPAFDLEDALGHELGIDQVRDGLMRHLAQNVARGFSLAKVSPSHDDLVAHAAELLGLGAVRAAGAVAGTAFERLIHLATTGKARDTLETKKKAGKHANLAKLIEAGWTGEQETQLLRLKDFRNSFAHPPGEPNSKAPQLSDEDLYDRVSSFIAWLARHRDDEDPVQLSAQDPLRDLEPREVHEEGVKAGEIAAAEAKPTAITVAGVRLRDGYTGTAEIVVRDRRRAFTAWLGTAGGGVDDEAGDVVRLKVNKGPLERSLAWAWAYCLHLEEQGVPVGYVADNVGAAAP